MSTLLKDKISVLKKKPLHCERIDITKIHIVKVVQKGNFSYWKLPHSLISRSLKSYFIKVTKKSTLGSPPSKDSSVRSVHRDLCDLGISAV